VKWCSSPPSGSIVTTAANFIAAAAAAAVDSWLLMSVLLPSVHMQYVPAHGP